MLLNNNHYATKYPPPNTERIEVLPEPGALNEWWSQLQRGLRTKYDVDPLYRAACAEMNARDALRSGLPSMANDYRRQAAEILLEAVAEDAA
jgi:hypothetical protein